MCDFYGTLRDTGSFKEKYLKNIRKRSFVITSVLQLEEALIKVYFDVQFVFHIRNSFYTGKRQKTILLIACVQACRTFSAFIHL